MKFVLSRKIMRMRAVNSFGQISSGRRGRKSLLVRTVISHFVEIGEVLKIETCSLLILDSVEGVTSFANFFVAAGNGFFVPMLTVNSYKHQFSAYKCH